jgi:predicted nucleic acid-binding Zn ribbon protein
MRRRKGSSTPRLLGEILPEALKMKALHVPMKDRSLTDAWNCAVGPQIGAKAQPDRLRDDVLYVRVANSVWMHELQFMKQDIISKLNGILGGTNISQIRFFIGEVEAPRVKHAGPDLMLDARDLKAEENDYIRETLAGVTDPDLKEILQKTMTRSILRGRKDS